MVVGDDVVDFAVGGGDIAAWVAAGAVAVSDAVGERSAWAVGQCAAGWFGVSAVTVGVFGDREGRIGGDGCFYCRDQRVRPAIVSGVSAA